MTRNSTKQLNLKPPSVKTPPGQIAPQAKNLKTILEIWKFLKNLKTLVIFLKFSENLETRTQIFAPQAKILGYFRGKSTIFF